MYSELKILCLTVRFVLKSCTIQQAIQVDIRPLLHQTRSSISYPSLASLRRTTNRLSVPVFFIFPPPSCKARKPNIQHPLLHPSNYFFTSVARSSAVGLPGQSAQLHRLISAFFFLSFLFHRCSHPTPRYSIRFDTGQTLAQPLPWPTLHLWTRLYWQALMYFCWISVCTSPADLPSIGAFRLCGVLRLQRACCHVSTTYARPANRLDVYQKSAFWRDMHMHLLHEHMLKKLLRMPILTRSVNRGNRLSHFICQGCPGE